MYFNPCPYCNSNLDPGEQCDCLKNVNLKKENRFDKETKERKKNERGANEKGNRLQLGA